MIKIHNFKFAGAFTLPATAEETGSWSSSDLAFPHAFTVVKNANITVNSNTAATDISTKTPMLNIPQTLTAWTVSAPNKSKWEADNAKQCYLEISCKIRQSGAYLLGSASEYKTIPCISLKGQKVFHSGYELRDKDKHDISILESLSK